MYAQGTTVPVEKSRIEIERTLVRYGANAFTSAWDQRQASIGFAFKGWHVRFDVKLPDPTEKRFTHEAHRTWTRRSLEGARKAYDQELRRIWRAFLMVIKAKLEAVTSGVTTFENEFLAHIVLPGQMQTVAEMALPRLEAAKQSGGSGFNDYAPGLPPAASGG
jgi:hypothetical protein